MRIARVSVMRASLGADPSRTVDVLVESQRTVRGFEGDRDDSGVVH